KDTTRTFETGAHTLARRRSGLPMERNFSNLAQLYAKNPIAAENTSRKSRERILIQLTIGRWTSEYWFQKPSFNCRSPIVNGQLCFIPMIPMPSYNRRTESGRYMECGSLLSLLPLWPREACFAALQKRPRRACPPSRQLLLFAGEVALEIST